MRGDTEQILAGAGAFLLFALMSWALPGTAATLGDFGPPEEPADWTIAVYMGSDNDLETFALRDLNEMEAGLSGRVNVVVLVDRTEGYESGEGDWTDARVYHIVPDKDPEAVRSTVIATPGELNMGDPAVLESFLTATYRKYPATRRALVLWNHGGGWATHVADETLPDGPGSDYLTLPELSSAIRSSLAATKIPTLDLIGFDMCLMAQIEMAVELEGLTSVMVASEATEPTDGWPYDRVLPALGGGDLDARAFAVEIVDRFHEFYLERNEAITTLSVLDMSELEKTRERLDAMLTKLKPHIPELWSDLSRTIYFSEGYAPRTELQRSDSALASIDLLDALDRMEHNIDSLPARRERSALRRQIEKLVVHTANSRPRRLSQGLAIYAPVTASTRNENYADTRFARVSQWPGFLDALHAAQQQSGRPPEIRGVELVDYKTERPASAVRPLNTQGIRYQVEGESLLWLHSLMGRRHKDSGSLLVYYRSPVVDANWSARQQDTAAERLDLMMPRFPDGRSTMTTAIDGILYVVSNGREALSATVDDSDLRGGLMSVPVLYAPPGAEQRFGRVYFHPKWWNAVAMEMELPRDDGSVVYRQVKPEPDHEVTLLVQTLTSDGNVEYVPAGNLSWGEGLELLLSTYKPGEYTVGLVAEAIGSLSEPVYFDFRIEDDPGLVEIMDQGDDYSMADLMGSWVLVNAAPFASQGRIEPAGLVYTYSKHPQQEDALELVITAPGRPGFRQRNLAFVDTRLLPHQRVFSDPEKQQDTSPLDVDFSVYVTLLTQQHGHTVMYQRNTVSGLNYVYVKAPEQGTGAAASPPGAPAVAAGLEGSWQSDMGSTLLMQNGQYELYDSGYLEDAGTYQADGQTLVSRSIYTGEVSTYAYLLSERRLILRDQYGEVYVYVR